MKITGVIKENKEIIIILIISLIIRVILLPHCICFDELRDTQLAEQYARNNTLFFRSHWYFLTPPLWYLFVAMVGNNYLFLSLANVIISIFGIFGVYLIGKDIYSKQAGYISAALFSFFPTYLLYSARGFNNILHTTLVIYSFLFLIMYIKSKKPAFSNVSTFLSFASGAIRYTSIFLPVLNILLMLKNKAKLKDVAIGIIFGALIFASLAQVNYSHTNKIMDFTDVYFQVFVGNADVHPWYYYILWFPVIYSPVALLGVYEFYKRRDDMTNILIIWFIFYFILLCISAVKIPRYTIVTLPPLMLSSGYGISRIKNRKIKLLLFYSTVVGFIIASVFINQVSAYNLCHIKMKSGVPKCFNLFGNSF